MRSIISAVLSWKESTITAKTKNGNIFQSIRYAQVALHWSMEVCKAGMDIFVAYIFMTLFKASTNFGHLMLFEKKFLKLWE